MLKKLVCKTNGHLLTSVRYQAKEKDFQYHRKIRVCARCGYEETEETVHTLIASDEIGENCMRYKICQECGLRVESGAMHEMKAIAIEIPEPCLEKIFKCTRCGEIRKWYGHEMVLTDSRVTHNDSLVTVKGQVLTCKKCGLVEENQDITYHDYS